MNIDWSTVTAVILASIPGIIVAFVSSFLAARQARKQHISQRWWEKKAEVYSELLRVLHGLKLCFENWEGPCVAFPRQRYDLEGQRNKFQEFIDVGPFIISRECYALLVMLHVKLEYAVRENSPVEIMRTCSDEIKEIIDQIIAAAKKDLGVG